MCSLYTESVCTVTAGCLVVTSWRTQIFSKTSSDMGCPVLSKAPVHQLFNFLATTPEVCNFIACCGWKDAFLGKFKYFADVATKFHIFSVFSQDLKILEIVKKNQSKGRTLQLAFQAKSLSFSDRWTMARRWSLTWHMLQIWQVNYCTWNCNTKSGTSVCFVRFSSSFCWIWLRVDHMRYGNKFSDQLKLRVLTFLNTKNPHAMRHVEYMRNRLWLKTTQQNQQNDKMQNIWNVSCERKREKSPCTKHLCETSRFDGGEQITGLMQHDNVEHPHFCGRTSRCSHCLSPAST